MAETEWTNVQVRLSTSELLEIEDWRRSQAKIPSRSEVLRTFVIRALRAEQDNREHAA